MYKQIITGQKNVQLHLTHKNRNNLTNQNIQSQRGRHLPHKLINRNKKVIDTQATSQKQFKKKHPQITMEQHKLANLKPN